MNTTDLTQRFQNQYYTNDLHGFHSVSRCSLPIKNPKLPVPSKVPLWYEKLPFKMRRWALEWYWKDRAEEDDDAWGTVRKSLFYNTKDTHDRELVEPYLKQLASEEYNVRYYTDLDGYSLVNRSSFPLYNPYMEEPSYLPDWYLKLSDKMKQWALEWFWSNVNTHTNVEDPELAFENVKYLMLIQD